MRESSLKKIFSRSKARIKQRKSAQQHCECGQPTGEDAHARVYQITSTKARGLCLWEKKFVHKKAPELEKKKRSAEYAASPTDVGEVRTLGQPKTRKVRGRGMLDAPHSFRDRATQGGHPFLPPSPRPHPPLARPPLPPFLLFLHLHPLRRR
jgi:hypothetical protein